ncbi:MAG: sensor domain-containing diguanylate cyclase [Rhodocyclales bacterium]|nr:sensor domain-containing diguanylate cyclase [Rhodocyclales bacterium]
MVTDHLLRIVFANDAFLATTGRSLGEIVGHPPSILGSCKRDHAFFRLVSRSLSASGKWRGWFEARRHEHAAHPAWMHIDAMHDAQGRVYGYVAVLSDHARPAPGHDELYRLAYHDPLTGLPNRQLFHDRINQAMVHARRSRTRFAVLFIDLDGFKQVNDQLGHRAGDCLLIEAARRMRGTIRESDTAARIAGDEFVMILNNVGTQADTGLVARKVVAALSLELPQYEAGRKITASVGIALFPDDGTSMQDLLERADQAMYQAKAKGGGCYCFHGTGPERNMVSPAGMTAEACARPVVNITYTSPRWQAGRSGRSLL